MDSTRRSFPLSPTSSTFRPQRREVLIFCLSRQRDPSGSIVGKVIPLLFAPGQNSRLIEQSSRLCVSLVFPFPLGHRNFFGSVAAPQSNKSILKYSCRMLEEILIFFTFCAN